MFNDGSTPLNLLATRRSGKARDLVAPGPDATQLAQILAAAIRVPDHGKLAPWRFITVADDRRSALAAVLEAAFTAENQSAGLAEIEAILQFALQAPALVIVVSTPNAHARIPVWEQQLSAGAATMMLCLAAHAHGFVANWLTGWACYSPAVATALGIGDGQIAGFIFIGTPARELQERPRPAAADIIRAY
jgi:nitroreductase